MQCQAVPPSCTRPSAVLSCTRAASRLPRCFLPAQQRHQSNALDARIEGRRSGAGSRRPRRCRCAASAAVPTAQPGKTKVAFLGIGIMGNAMAANLLKAGYEVTVWNRSPDKCAGLAAAGATVAGTPAEAVAACDIALAMLSDPEACLAVATGPEGVASAMAPGKGYVDVSMVDAATSRQVAVAVRAAGGAYLEAPVSGSKGRAARLPAPAFFALRSSWPPGRRRRPVGARRDESLFEAAAPLLEVMGKASFFLGEAGAGANMKLVVNMVMGSMMASYAEGLQLAQRCGLRQEDLIEVVKLGAIASPMFALKAPGMVAGKFPTAFPLKHQQKDLRLALALGDEVQQPLPLAAAANELYKRARAAGYSDADFSAVMAGVGSGEQAGQAA